MFRKYRGKDPSGTLWWLLEIVVLEHSPRTETRFSVATSTGSSAAESSVELGKKCLWRSTTVYGYQLAERKGSPPTALAIQNNRKLIQVMNDVSMGPNFKLLFEEIQY